MSVIYCAPSSESVDAYAREVCEKLAQQIDPSYADYEVVSGLAGFLKLLSRIRAKQLSEVVDSDNSRR